MHEYTLENGTKIHLSEKDVAGISAMGSTAGNSSAHYRHKTEELERHAANEIREMTGDHPEDLKDMFEFAVKHKLFGNRTETHVMCNFLKLLFAMLQKETHS